MSEKLTVAELLARSGRTPGEGERPRRRRRSLENGGVSVAELTGRIPVVREDAETPEQKPERPEEKTGKMAAVPDQAAAVPAAPARDSATSGPTFGEVVREEQSAADSAGSDSAGSDSVGSGSAGTGSAGTDITADTAEPAAANEPTESAETTESVEPVAAAAAVKEVPKTESVEAEAGDAGAGDTEAADTAAVDADVTEPEAGTDLADMTDTPADAEHTQSEEDAAQADATPVDDPADAPTETTETTDHDEYDEVAALEDSLADNEVIEYEDDTISWPAMIAQALVAVALGVGVFFGFGLLWGNLPTLVVLVLALAVTLLAVGLVHATLRHRDKGLMLLAFIVGLVLTIGPRLIISI